MKALAIVAIGLTMNIIFRAVPVYAQEQPVRVMEVKAQKSVFVYKKYAGGRMMFVSKKGTIPAVFESDAKVKRTVNFMDIDDVKYIDKKSISKSVKEVFSTSRMQELIPEGKIFLTFYFDKAGKLLAIDFGLRENSKITPVELEKWDAALKKNITAILPADLPADGVIKPISQLFSFEWLLSGIDTR